MLDALRRALRRKGHGIHSPYAFRLVTGVFADPGAYYAYPMLERLGRSTGSDPGWLKLLFRLICEFQPAELQVPESLPDIERQAIMAADSRLRLTRAEAPVSYCLTAPASLPESGAVIIREISRPELEALTTERGYGMVFRYKHAAVIVMRHDLPAQTFEI